MTSNLDTAADEIRTARADALRLLPVALAYLETLGQQGDTLAAEIARRIDSALNRITMSTINGTTAIAEQETNHG